MQIEQYFNKGDIVKDKYNGEEWEVINYKEIFNGTISMKETEMLYCRNLHTKEVKLFKQEELSFVRSNHKPFIFK